MSWTGTRVLVTGAGGFIGSHLTEALVEAGATVTAMVHYRSTGALGLLSLAPTAVRDAIRVVAGDLRDADTMAQATEGQEVVFHLGALIAIPYSYRHPADVVQTNVVGTLNALMAARRAGVARFVHTSTSEVYGTAQRVPMAETHPLSPQSPYAASKVGADALVTAFHRSYGLPAVTVRPFNTYGPRQSGRAVIPAIAAQALRASEIRLGALTPTRDFTFVTDTVAAFLALARCDAALGRVVNLGSGQEVSIGALAERIRQVVGRDVAIISTAERLRPATSEVERLLGDASEARALTGWGPRVALDEGLARVVAFLRERPDWAAADRYEV